MGSKQGKKPPHRGRRKKGGIISGIILVIALIVFCVSGFNLIKYGKGYLAGRSEYRKIRDIAIEEGKDAASGFKVNFDELFAINPDTVGWIRFYPEPATINYPLVQGTDNQEYLHKTFSEGENTLGAIFVAAENRANMQDKNTIIYGHRMNDRSMFYHLEDYKDPEFCKQNPYFYIYTPDGAEHVYQIYSVAVVDEFSDTYITKFASKEKFQEFIKMTKETSLYDTGVEVGADDKIVTLSTCTSNGDNERNVVRGVLVEKEE